MWRTHSIVSILGHLLSNSDNRTEVLLIFIRVVQDALFTYLNAYTRDWIVKVKV